MKQYTLINKIVGELDNRDYLKACYISGSFGRKEEDEYSNVDIYVCIHTKDESNFETNKLAIFEMYGEIIYHRQDNEVDTIIYRDGVMLRFHKVFQNVNGIIEVDNNAIIIYNNYGIIKNNLSNQNEFSYIEIGKLIDSLSINALEFSRNYRRNDYPIILRLSSDIHYQYSMIKHYISNPRQAKLGAKNILKSLNSDERKAYVEIIKAYSFQNLKQFVLMILNDLDKALVAMPVMVAQNFDYDLFAFVRKKVMEL